MIDNFCPHCNFEYGDDDPLLCNSCGRSRTLYMVLTADEDCWTIEDEAGVQRPHRFASFAAAQANLDVHMAEMDEDGIDYEPAEFRIVEVTA